MVKAKFLFLSALAATTSAWNCITIDFQLQVVSFVVSSLTLSRTTCDVSTQNLHLWCAPWQLKKALHRESRVDFRLMRGSGGKKQILQHVWIITSFSKYVMPVHLHCLRAWILCEISCKTIKAFFSFIVVPPCCHPSDQICKLQRLIHWASRVLKSLLMPVSQRWKLMQFLVKIRLVMAGLQFWQGEHFWSVFFSHVDVYRASIGCLFSHGSEKPWRWLDMVSFCLIFIVFWMMRSYTQLMPTFTETLQGLALPFEILRYWSLMNLKKSFIFPPDLRSMLPRNSMAIPWMRSYHVVWRFGLQGRLVRSWCRRCTSSYPNSRNLQQLKLEGAHLAMENKKEQYGKVEWYLNTLVVASVLAKVQLFYHWFSY